MVCCYLHNKAVEKCVYNVLFSNVGRKSSNEDNSTGGFGELWVVEEGVLDVLFEFWHTGEVAFAPDANDQCRCFGFGTDATPRQ